MSADPYFNRTSFPPLFPTLRPRRSGAVLRPQNWCRAARAPRSGTNRRAPNLCKKLSKGNVPVITPEANTLLVKEQLDENDDFLPKLQQYFVITKDQNDKVSHLELQRHFLPEITVRALNA